MHFRMAEEARKAFEIVKRAAHVKQARIELAWMEIEEEARRGEAELEQNTANLRRCVYFIIYDILYIFLLVFLCVCAFVYTNVCF